MKRIYIILILLLSGVATYATDVKALAESKKLREAVVQIM